MEFLTNKKAPDVNHAHKTRFVIGGTCITCKKGKKWKVKVNKASLCHSLGLSFEKNIALIDDTSGISKIVGY